MRALRVQDSGKSLVMAEMPIPVPGAYDLLVRVLACGVCRSDLHIIDGELPARVPGIVPGHEVVGHSVGLESLNIGKLWQDGALSEKWRTTSMSRLEPRIP